MEMCCQIGNTFPKIGNKFIEIREDVIQEYFAKTGIKIEGTAKVPSNEERGKD